MSDHSKMLDRDVLSDDRRHVDAAVLQEILERLELSEKFMAARWIIVKPNFAGGSAVPLDSHAVSDTAFLRELVEALHELNPAARLAIAESDSSGPGFAYMKFEHLGLTEWKFPYLELLDLSRDRLEKIEDRRFRYFGEINGHLYLSRELMASDFFISTANLKTHAVTRFTGGCKNLFGLLPRTEKYYYHTHISDVIHDLYRAKTPDLTVVDGFYGMEGNGPIIGKPIDLGFRVWCRDAAAGDAVAAAMIRIHPARVRHLKLILGSKGCSRIARLPLPRHQVRFRGKRLAFFNSFGLWLQDFGDVILMYGHRAHSAYSFTLWGYLTLRPLLLRFVSLEKLKELKKKWRH